MIINAREKAVCVFGVFCLVYCTMSSAVEKPSEIQWRSSSNANLMHISFLLVRTKNQSIEELLACHDGHEKCVEIVSAERVFLRALRETSMPEDLLVHGAHRRALKPENPGAKTVVGKWGSSYSTWCMSAEKWKLAKEFWWCHNGRDLALPFPILWDKKPELCGERVPILTIQGNTERLPAERLDAYLKAASQWVQPRKQPLKEVLGMLRSDAVENRIWAVRLLGARKEAEHIPAIARFLKDPHLEVRFAAAWALGMIGNPVAIPYLEADLRENPGSPRGHIASALGQIGGAGAIEPLARLLKDRNATVRKRAASSMAATGSEKAIPHLVEALGDEEKAVRQAALRSLTKLGWEPPKDPNDSPEE